ncbi:MAG: TerC/Alx family metal homeostasis membrane protein [Candidatus Paracaedibacteraceae bacterium]|nr:TerC/Alx family metal homeostasis membrane protein [Candidatus Paracaedibacteraceae bacterium]
MQTPVLFWTLLGVLITLLLAIDLKVSSSKSREASIKLNALLTLMYVGIAFLFCGFVWHTLGAKPAKDFFYAWFLEKTLSIDNVMVMSCVFSYFKIPSNSQHRVLFYGILGVIILRAIAIGAGISLIHHFHWLMYGVSVLLIIMGIKMLFDNKKNTDFSKNVALTFMQKHLRITNTLHGNSFIITKVKNGVAQRWVTPLFVALIIIEFLDIIFALDSLPAIFAITTDPFIVYSSNIFAILGLRSLYFVLSSMSNRFGFIHYLVGIMLVFIGIKSLYKLIF